MGYQVNEDYRVPFTTRRSFASVPAVSTLQQTVPLPGLRLSDIVEPVLKQTFQSGLILSGARCTAPGVMVVELTNVTAGAILPTVNDLYTFTLTRPEKVLAEGVPV